MKTFFGFQCEIGAFKDTAFNPGYIPTQSSCWKTTICSFWIVYQSKIKTGPSPHPKMDEAPRSVDVFVGKCIWGCKHNRWQHKQVWPRCTADLLINGGLWRGAAEWLIELRTSSAMFWWNRREDKGLCRSAADMRVKCWGGGSDEAFASAHRGCARVDDLVQFRDGSPWLPCIEKTKKNKRPQMDPDTFSSPLHTPFNFARQQTTVYSLAFDKV